MIRITGGEFRSRKLLTPVNESITKPTMDRVREGVFSALQNDIYGKNVLDLFAGSGAYGFEALSRGAKKATFIDKDQDAINVIKRNAHALNVESRYDLEKMDVFSFLEGEAKEQYNLIFVDPPYKDYDYTQIVKALLSSKKISEDAIIVLESEDNLAINEADFEKVKQYRYGLAKIYICRR